MSEIRSIAAQLPTDEPAWFAFRVMHKREKLAAKRLAARGLEAYVPLQTVVRQYASRRKTVILPLFNGYLFARITVREYPQVLADPDVFEVIRFNGEVGRVTNEEVEFLRRVLRTDEAYALSAAELLVPGQRVRIAGGPLAGTRGSLVEKQGKHNFLVRLESIGLSLKLVVDEGVLELDERG